MDIYNILKSLENIEKKALTESTEPVKPMVAESSMVRRALASVAGDLDEFARTGQVSDDLYDAAFDYYSKTGEMPYEAAKAKTVDPYEWVANQLHKDLGLNEVTDAELDAQALAQHKARLARDRNRRAMTAPGAPAGDRSKVPAAVRKARGEEELSYKELDETEGKEIDYKSLEIDGIDYNDAPDFVDAYFSDGYYTDGTPLSDADLEELSGDYDLVHKYVMNHLYEDDMEEGNAFSGAVAKAKADGIQPGETITVGGKKYPVKEGKKAKPDYIDLDKDGNKKESMKKAAKDKEKMDEAWPGTPEYELRFGKPDSASAFDKKKISTGTVYTRKHKEEPEADDSDAPKKKGRPAGSKRALGAKGPSGQSKLLKGKSGLKEQDIDVVDRGEYDREGDMAHGQLHTLKDAAEELCNLVSPDQNLPEWVQSKITKAMDYIDTARDYLKSQHEMDQEVVKEKAPPGAKAERMVKHIKKGYAKDGDLTDKEKSIAYATAWKAKKAGKVEEEGLGKKIAHGVGKVVKAVAPKWVEKQVKKDDNARTASKKAAVDKFLSHAQKAEKNNKKDVEETTVAGSVATSTDAPKKAKGGMEFGKGVYEGAIAESFEKKLGQVLNESTNLTVNVDDQGQKSVSISATGADADHLSDLLKMAGLFSSEGYSRACPECGGVHEAGACSSEQVDEELANAPDEKYADADYMLNDLSGGLNGPKSTGQTTGPITNRQDSRQGVLAKMDEATESTKSRLWSLYKEIGK